MALTARQIKARAAGVGCSEALAALGKDPRCTRRELYARKTGELPLPDLSNDERVRFGVLLEPVLRQEFSRRIGAQVMAPRGTLTHQQAPLIGHPDGWMPQLRAGVEIKCADKFEASEFGEPGTDQIPIRYLVQCAGYMALTEANHWYLCVLIGGNDLRIYDIARDADLEAALLAGVREFWGCVTARTPPNPETPQDVRLHWPRDKGTSVVATPEIVDACDLLREARYELAQAQEAEATAKAHIQSFMAEAGSLVDADGTLLATWKSAKATQRFDAERFEAEHPDLYRQYLNEQAGSRRFLLK